MGNRLRARIVDIHRIEVAGVAGCAQPLVLGLKQNHAQNIVNNVGRSGDNANVLACAVADAPRNGPTERWCAMKSPLVFDSAPAWKSVS
jgi:hypothetical protein